MAIEIEIPTKIHLSLFALNPAVFKRDILTLIPAEQK